VYDPRRGAVSTWVLTIARNLTIDALRMRRAVPTDPDELINLGLVSNEATPESAALSGDAARGLRQALAALSPEQRRALVLAYFYGMTALEISQSESIPLGTAKTRIRAGLIKLRDTMTIEGSPR
jgi:RNA polymerase sigma-70 factor (ECF subfamily)